MDTPIYSATSPLLSPLHKLPSVLPILVPLVVLLYCVAGLAIEEVLRVGRPSGQARASLVGGSVSASHGVAGGSDCGCSVSCGACLLVLTRPFSVSLL